MQEAGQKSVSVRPGAYRKLIQYAANLQQRQGRKISLTEALSHLIDAAIQDFPTSTREASYGDRR